MGVEYLNVKSDCPASRAREPGSALRGAMMAAADDGDAKKRETAAAAAAAA